MPPDLIEKAFSPITDRVSEMGDAVSRLSTASNSYAENIEAMLSASENHALRMGEAAEGLSRMRDMTKEFSETYEQISRSGAAVAEMHGKAIELTERLEKAAQSLDHRLGLEVPDRSGRGVTGWIRKHLPLSGAKRE